MAQARPPEHAGWDVAPEPRVIRLPGQFSEPEGYTRPSWDVSRGQGRLDEKLLTELYRRFAPLVHARASRILGGDADDVVHEVFLRLLRSAPGADKIASWVFSTSTHLAIDRLRERARRDEGWQREVREATSGQPMSVEALLAHKDLCRKLLRRLDRKTQEVVMLVYFDEMTQEEAATALRVSRKTVNERLRRFHAEAEGLAARWTA